MSLRIRTSKPGEDALRSLGTALFPDRPWNKFDKWRLLRLAMAVSMRRPLPPGEDPSALSPRDRQGAEYRLQQLTGEGKPARGEKVEDEDITNLVRGLLSVAHGIDLFDPKHDDALFGRLLEFHLDRGLQEIQRQRDEQGDLFTALIRLLAPPSSEVVAEASSLKVDRIKSAFWEMGVHVEPMGPAVEGPRLSHVTLRVPSAGDLPKVEASLGRLSFILGGKESALSLARADQPKTLILSMPRARETWTEVGILDLRRSLEQPSDQALPLPLGVDAWGQPVQRDLARAPHLLVAGTTGSGKSVALHGMICGLLLRCPASLLKLVLCDAKGPELAPYNGAPQLHGEPVVTEVNAIHEALREAVAEMDRRYPLLQGRGLRDLAEGRGAGLDLPYIVVVLDELADLLMQRPEAEGELVRLAQKGRAAGVHLILATQRPDARTLTGLLRSNVPARVALAVQRASESTIILDEPGAEGLLKPGDMLVRWDGGAPLRAHAYNLRPDDVSGVVRAASRSGS